MFQQLKQFFKNNFFQIPIRTNSINTIIFFKRLYYYYRCGLVENKLQSTTAKVPTHGYTHEREDNPQYWFSLQLNLRAQFTTVWKQAEEKLLPANQQLLVLTWLR